MSSSPIAESIVIQLDGKPHSLASGTSLAELVTTLGYAEQAVATAVNQNFIPRGQRPATRLQEGDHVLFFQPIVGG